MPYSLYIQVYSLQESYLSSFFEGSQLRTSLQVNRVVSLIFSPKFSPGSHQLNLSSYVIASVFIVSCYKYKTNVNTVKSNIQLYSVYFAPYHFLVVTVSIYRGWLQTPLWCPLAVPLLASSKISLQDHTIFQFEYCYQKENQNMLLRICQFPQMTMSALLLPPFIRLNYKCKHSSQTDFPVSSISKNSTQEIGTDKSSISYRDRIPLGLFKPLKIIQQ